MEFRVIKLEIFVPEEFVVPIRYALSRVGAGKIGRSKASTPAKSR